MKKYPFTILELLLVISIGAVMLTVALPAFNRMLKGSASGVAIRELTARLSAARSKAMSNGSHRVAIVFPANEDFTSDQKHKKAFAQRYRYRAYRACYVDASSLTFIKWVDGDNWKFLPEGIVLEAKVEKDDSKLASGRKEPIYQHRTEKETKISSQELHTTPLTCKIGGRSYSEDSIGIAIRNFIMFNQNGTLDEFPNGAVLRLREGKVGTDGEVIESNIKEYFPIVIRATGKIKAYNELVED